MNKGFIRALCFFFCLVAATLIVAPVKLWVPIMLTGSVIAMWVFLLTVYISQRRSEK